MALVISDTKQWTVMIKVSLDSEAQAASNERRGLSMRPVFRPRDHVSG